MKPPPPKKKRKRVYVQRPWSRLPVNGAALAPVVSLQTAGEVAAKTTLAASLRVDTTTHKFKYGMQLATKV